jgi:hypothetical protein
MNEVWMRFVAGQFVFDHIEDVLQVLVFVQVDVGVHDFIRVASECQMALMRLRRPAVRKGCAFPTSTDLNLRREAARGGARRSLGLGPIQGRAEEEP